MEKIRLSITIFWPFECWKIQFSCPFEWGNIRFTNLSFWSIERGKFWVSGQSSVKNFRVFVHSSGRIFDCKFLDFVHSSAGNFEFVVSRAWRYSIDNLEFLVIQAWEILNLKKIDCGKLFDFGHSSLQIFKFWPFERKNIRLSILRSRSLWETFIFWLVKCWKNCDWEFSVFDQSRLFVLLFEFKNIWLTILIFWPFECGKLWVIGQSVSVGIIFDCH